LFNKVLLAGGIALLLLGVVSLVAPFPSPLLTTVAGLQVTAGKLIGVLGVAVGFAFVGVSPVKRKRR